MHLLATSTPQHRNTVKILVYGQSISVQDWWLEVKRDLTARFPNANLIMENKSIGGFSSSLLVKTTEMDVSSFYPDLVLFHVYDVYKLKQLATSGPVSVQSDSNGQRWLIVGTDSGFEPLTTIYYTAIKATLR
jgi:hypothetical protein